jgi:hypothetical protein
MVLSRILALAMRLLVLLGLALVSIGCAGPHSTGALWAQQNLDAERAMFQLGETRRAQLAQAFELSLVDEQVASEQKRLAADLQTCPGPRQPLALSSGDRLRDTARVRAQADPAHLSQVANVALADWYVRRAQATGDALRCQRAQQVLSGVNGAGSSDANVLDGLPTATVTRDPNVTPNRTLQVPTDANPPIVSVSNYGLGAVDTVQAAAPLPQYLAGVYGGMLLSSEQTPSADPETVANLVDREAPDYPQWEPDALYLALRGGVMP